MALFAAIELGEEARRAALRAIDVLVAASLPVRFERPEKLHVTLAFLGAIPAQRIAEFAGALGAAAVRCPPFEIVFDRLGAFPDERRPRILALGCSQPQTGFDACAAIVRAQFEKLGARFEQQALPHITLARAKQPLHHLPSIEQPPRCVVAVRELVLFESIQEGPTTRYAERSSARLSTTGRINSTAP
jgi:2'-5' RNA ligase